MTAIAPLYFISTPQSFMRQEPTEAVKVSSELYFSEQVYIIDEKEQWAFVENRIDGYRGWVKKATLCARQSIYPQEHLAAKVNRQKAHIYSVQDTEYGPLLTLPFESKLEVIRECSERWLEVVLPDGKSAFIQRGDVLFQDEPLCKSEMCAFSRSFQGLPYTWGGRSTYLGYDCSGFVQMLYRQMGIFLPRDAKDQVKWEGLKACSIEELEPGDLLFWGMNAQDIRHVGLFLGEDTFIHATVRQNKPYIRISSLIEPEFNGDGYYPYRTARKS